MTCSMGVIYLLGDYLSEVAVMGMSQVNREPLFLSYVGQAFGGEAGATLTPIALAPSYGARLSSASRTRPTTTTSCTTPRLTA